MKTIPNGAVNLSYVRMDTLKLVRQLSDLPSEMHAGQPQVWRHLNDEFVEVQFGNSPLDSGTSIWFQAIPGSTSVRVWSPEYIGDYWFMQPDDISALMTCRFEVISRQDIINYLCGEKVS